MINNIQTHTCLPWIQTEHNIFHHHMIREYEEEGVYLQIEEKLIQLIDCNNSDDDQQIVG